VAIVIANTWAAIHFLIAARSLRQDLEAAKSS